MSIGPTRTYGAIVPGSQYITSLVRQGAISKEAAKRLRWMDHYNRYQNARLTCRYYGISLQVENYLAFRLAKKSFMIIITTIGLLTTFIGYLGISYTKDLKQNLEETRSTIATFKQLPPKFKTTHSTKIFVT